MLNSDVLEVAIGLVFVYLLLSLIATSARESLEAFLKQRGQALEQGLVELLGAKDRSNLLDRFYNHPLIYSLYRGDYAAPPAQGDKAPPDRKAVAKRLPSYIPAANFALAVLDTAAGSQNSSIPLTIERVSKAVDSMPPGQLKDMLRLAVQTSQNDLGRAQKFLEDWYDAAMDRVSGAYRRNTQAIIFGLSLVLCVALNVNTVLITDALSHNLTLREAVVAQAEGAARNPPAANLASNTNAQVDQILEAGLPIGWNDATFKQMTRLLGLRGPSQPGQPGQPAQIKANQQPPAKAIEEARSSPGQAIFGGLELLGGWIATAFAITLGAPFWFDVLNKLVVVRSTVKPAEKSGQEASKDPASAQPSPGPPQPASPGPAAAPVLPPAPQAIAPAPPDPADQAAVMALDPVDRPREDA